MEGIAPFTEPGNLSTPNSAYFRRADAMIRVAATYGMTVIFDPIETAGWCNILKMALIGRSHTVNTWPNAIRSFRTLI